LINGTQVSNAISIIGLLKIQKIFSISLISGALSIDAFAASMQPFHELIGELKNCRGQQIVSQTIRNFLSGSSILNSHVDCPNVQDPYSIRCQPQVMGAVWNYLYSVKKYVMQEANSVSDNPLICREKNDVISGGNFHAELIGFSSDFMSILCSEIGSISERRIALLIDSKFSGLPAFLVKDCGLNSGFMIAHVTASSLVSENKTFAHPATVDSIPTSANQEDHVSMATFASTKLHKITDNVLYILAIETLAACQGIDLRRPLTTSNALQSKLDMVRESVSFYDKDRFMANDILKAHSLIQRETYYQETRRTIFDV